MVGNEDLLFLVFHRAVPPVGGQFLDYMLLDATQRKILHQGQLALHPEAKLDWIGFSDTNVTSTFSLLFNYARQNGIPADARDL